MVKSLLGVLALLFLSGWAHSHPLAETLVASESRVAFGWFNDDYIYVSRVNDTLRVYRCETTRKTCSFDYLLHRGATDLSVLDVEVINGVIYFILADYEGPGILASVSEGCIKAGNCARALTWHRKVEGFALVFQAKHNRLFVEGQSGLHVLVKHKAGLMMMPSPYRGTGLEFHDYYWRGDDLFFASYSDSRFGPGVLKLSEDGSILQVCQGIDGVKSVNVDKDGNLVFINNADRFTQMITLSSCNGAASILYRGNGNESIDSLKLSKMGGLLFLVEVGNGRYELRMIPKN